MTSYAPVPAFAERRRHPRALILIVAGHAALLAAVMAVKMDLAPGFDPVETNVTLVPLPPEPPPPQPPRPAPEPPVSAIDRPAPLIPIPVPPDAPLVDPTPIPVPNPGPMIGTSIGPKLDPPAKPLDRTGPRFATPDSQLRPPYPPGKLDSGEQASLRLRLSIDARGRVTAVEPVAPADPVFLAAARKHLIARWRYRPATEGGRPVASTTLITLRFELE